MGTDPKTGAPMMVATNSSFENENLRNTVLHFAGVYPAMGTVASQSGLEAKTIREWLKRGRTEGVGPYYEFNLEYARRRSDLEAKLTDVVMDASFTYRDEVVVNNDYAPDGSLIKTRETIRRLPPDANLALRMLKSAFPERYSERRIWAEEDESKEPPKPPTWAFFDDDTPVENC